VDTGFSDQDAAYDFSKARRSQRLAEIGRWMRREPDDVAHILPFEEVVDALGRVSESYAGLQPVPLDAIVGSVDRTREFDRSFRPVSPRLRSRWERIAAAQRRGESLPPISVYRIGDLYFVRDGHHRVSVARSLGRPDIDAYVTEVQTRIRPGEDIRVTDLPLKDHERLFRERVPLDGDRHARITVSDPWDWPGLAEAVEAWGMRAMQARRAYMDRSEVARLWFDDEYAPVTEMLREGELLERDETEADAYMRIASRRYRLLRTHEWTPEILERLAEEDESVKPSRSGGSSGRSSR
jgi:hypothetical protein